MRTFLRSVCAAAAVAGLACVTHKARQAPQVVAAPDATEQAAVAAAPADTFTSAVRPVLVRRCAPCHEPGGKMYARLPFDDATVVRDHQAAIVRRLKDAEERAALESWLAAR